MEDIRADKLSPLARKAFLRLLPIQIIEVVVFAINTFIDSVITSRFLGTDSTPADKSLNLGAVLDIFPEGAYHIYDYKFFFTNLKENAAKRAQVWETQQLDAAA